MTNKSSGWERSIWSVLNQGTAFQEQPFYVPKAGNVEVGICE